MISCPICASEDFDPEDPSHVYLLDHCGHAVHCAEDCYKNSVQLHIGEHMLSRPVCVEANQLDGAGSTVGKCGQALSDPDIVHLVGQEILDKVTAAEKEKATPALRRCPVKGCGWSKVCDPTQLRIDCPDCGAVFCFEHDQACQAGGKMSFEQNCDNYASSKDFKANEAYVQGLQDAGKIKQCPHCHAKVSKQGGCNAMLCTVCNTGFCWICGEEIQDADGLPIHFMRWNTTSNCAGRQFEGMDGSETDALGFIELNCCERTVQVALFVIIFLIMIPFVIVACLFSCLIACLFDCCLVCCYSEPALRDLHRTRTQYLTMFILVLPGLLVSAIFWLPWYCYLRCKIQNMQHQLAGGDDPEMAQARQASVESFEADRARSNSGGIAKDYGTLPEHSGDLDLENPAALVGRSDAGPPESEALLKPGDHTS
eukprot:TRINITY_DN17799_c0_g1_i12.p1 TRINITY_DN17799_c0_g1~~TRINITY_DN17799_c0_g1_i12.p1  ORF type:complete len:427 (-),score=99.95 TRINITY_DN17799_c0_g1_i12:525-1805(-)